MADHQVTDARVCEFGDMGLDDRLLKAIADLKWKKPTLIQERAIPLALEGKDILARARTGSGKTAAYIIPMLQKILSTKLTSSVQCVRALVVVPTKELGSQAHRNVIELSQCCSRDVRVVDVCGKVPLSAQKAQLSERPDIVVGTPTRLVAHIAAGNLTLEPPQAPAGHTQPLLLVIDEADLIFSFGYHSDINILMSAIGTQTYQAILMSATLSSDVRTLKQMVLHNPVILRLEEEPTDLPPTSQLTQYYIQVEEEDKFLLIYTLLKLNLIRGKSLIFVNTVDKCYKVKLFLEQFAIPSCILNSELPVNSRINIVNQFNNGLYDIIIASDEASPSKPTATQNTTTKATSPTRTSPLVTEPTASEPKKSRKKDRESGVSRGIDFQNVSNVINLDFPPTLNAYIHRVGRTARGMNRGAALSFVTVEQEQQLDTVVEYLNSNTGEEVMKKFQFDMGEVEGFRYRARDAYRAVTKVAVREARLKEIKTELINSQKLKVYFECNPRDLQVLRHDRCLHTVKVQPHLKDVPDYLVPAALRNSRDLRTAAASSSSSAHHPGGRRGGKRRATGGGGGGDTALTKQQLKYKKKCEDPLQCVQVLKNKKKGNKRWKK